MAKSLPPFPFVLNILFVYLPQKKYGELLRREIGEVIVHLNIIKPIPPWTADETYAFRKEEIQFLYRDKNKPEAIAQFEKKLNEVFSDNLQRDYDALKTLIVDYYIALVTLNEIKTALSLEADSQLTNQLKKILSTEIPLPDRYSGKTIHKIIDRICQAETFERAWRLYETYQNLLRDFTFVKYNDGRDKTWKVIDLYKPLCSESRPQISSIFYRGQVNGITRGAILREKNTILDEYNVVLDSNVASYLRSASRGKNVPVDLEGIKRFIHNTPGVQFDYLPFIIEQRLAENYDESSLFKDIFNIERLYYAPSQKSDKFCTKETQKQIKATEYLLPQILPWYEKIYARLLIIAWVYLCFHGTPNKQYEEVCTIFSKELLDYPIPELSMAYDFYHHHSVPFLSCIQKTTKGLVKKIKNMAWDIFHLRFLYERSMVLDGGEISFQFICTFDSNLTKIIKYFELDALAVCAKTGECFPYFHINRVPESMIKKYFLKIDANANIDTKAIIQKYKALIEAQEYN